MLENARVGGLTLAVAAFVALGCGPQGVSQDDVYPRNCGIEGPVDLLSFDVGGAMPVAIERAGDHYLVGLSESGEGPQWLAVDRCGETSVPIAVDETLVEVGVGGRWILTCEIATGAISVVDSGGVSPATPLFPATSDCRVLAVGGGLAASEPEGGAVWFQPNPGSGQAPLLVVEQAAVERGGGLRVAGEDILVLSEDRRLLAYSVPDRALRVLDEGPVGRFDVLADFRTIAVDSPTGPTRIVDRVTGATFEFCCGGELNPVRQFGDWLTWGSLGPSTTPEQPKWTNFRTHDLATGERTAVTGRETWHVLARRSADSLLVDIGGYRDRETTRYIVWPASGDRERVDFEGEDLWTYEGIDGVFAIEGALDSSHVPRVRYLSGTDRHSARLVLDGVEVLFATRDGRIVFQRAVEAGEETPLWVMLPDESVVEIASATVGATGVSVVEGWPVDRDEVLYGVRQGSSWVLRRTVLP